MIDKNIKTRKEHICFSCRGVISKGSIANFTSYKAPSFKEGKQVGIRYVKLYFHLEYENCFMKSLNSGEKNLINSLKNFSQKLLEVV